MFQETAIATLQFSSIRTRCRSLIRFLLFAWSGVVASITAFAEDDVSAGVTVKVWSLPDPANYEPQNLARLEVVRRFHELHPYILLKADEGLIIQGAEMDAAPLFAINGNSSPDVIYVNLRQSGTYIEKGFLYPLDEYMAQLSEEEIKERIPAKLLPVVYRTGPTGELTAGKTQKHYWTMPIEISAMVLFYRKDLFAEAGLDPDRPPSNWNEMWNFAEKIADPGQGVYGVGIQRGPAGGWGIFPYLSSAGAQVVTELPDGRWKATFDSEEAVSAYAFVDKLLLTSVTKNGRSGPIAYQGSEQMNDLFQAGRLGMVFSYLRSSEFYRLDPALLGIAQAPKGPTGISSAELNAFMLGIFSGVKEKRVRDAAWEFIRFLDSEEARRIYTRTMVELGAFRQVNPVWLDEFGYSHLAKVTLASFVEAYRQAIETGTPEPYGKNCQFIYEFLARPLDRIRYTKFESAKSRLADIRSILQEAVRETNEQMLGEIPADVRNTRRTVAWGVALIALLSFLVCTCWVMRRISRELFSPSGRLIQRHLVAIGFLLPAMLLVLWWQYYPLLRGLVMAFQDYKIIGQTSWVGISNFADVLFDLRFWIALKNAGYFCLLWMLMGFFPPVILAIILQEIPLGKLTFRILFYIPAVVSGIVILFMWTAIYDPSPEGLFNQFIGLVGIPAQSWLLDPNLAMICVVFPIAWAHLGPGSIIYLAALKVIPGEVYEASDIDGAGFFTKVFRIALPYLKPLLVINAIGAIIFGFRSSDAILAMTGGGPDGATQVIGYEIWQKSFLYLQFGRATAMAWILALFLLGFTAHLMRVQSRVEFRTAS